MAGVGVEDPLRCVVVRAVGASVNDILDTKATRPSASAIALHCAIATLL